MGTVNVLEAARHSRSVRALVHVSTDKCYESSTSHHARSEDDPLGGDDPYSASKAAAELALAAYSRSFYSSPASPVLTASGRAGNVIGGGDWAEDRIIPDCVRAIAQQRAIAVRNPGSIRPWQHVLEALCGYLALGAHLLAGARALCGPWNFGPDQTNATTVANVVDALVRAWGQGRWEHLQEDATMHEAPSLFLSSEKAHRQLGWRPRWDFAETVRRTAYWYRAHAEGNDARHLCLDDIHAYMYCDDAIWPPCASGSGQPSGTP
jgi:CDP-glucose 4,6-dehydratase